MAKPTTQKKLPPWLKQDMGDEEEMPMTKRPGKGMPMNEKDMPMNKGSKKPAPKKKPAKRGKG